MKRFIFGVIYAGITVSLGAFASEPFRDCEDCPLMVMVPAGTFQMGTAPGGYEAVEPTGEMPAVTLRVPTAFAIGAQEITRGQFAVFLERTAAKPPQACRAWVDGRWTVSAGADWQSPAQPENPEAEHPANCVSWHDAMRYAEWLTEFTGERYRLPSEAEWEYAARGGNPAPRWWGWNSFEGVSISDACEHANVYDVSGMRALGFPWPHARCDDRQVEVAPVRTYDANAYGVFDVIGNVSEWTMDCFTGSYPNRPPDSRPWVWEGGCETRVVRGGSWTSRPLQARSTHRAHQAPEYRGSDTGFRVVKELTPFD